MKVHLRSLGCRLNQAEMDALGRNLLQGGHELTGDPTHAGDIVVNTCSVTREAGADSRALVRELGRRAPAARITVTGCHAQLASQEMRSLPNVLRVVGNMEKEGIVDLLDAPSPDAATAITRKPGMRTRAFVKVQDGCDHACTFCVTTLARGPGRSRPLAEVLVEIQQLHALNFKEAVLSGVQLGSYGRDLGLKQGLAELLRAILAETDIPRLRLSSLEPWDLTPDLPDLWQDSRLCRHLHLPLQSGCAATLRRMRRRCSPEEFSALLRDFRARVPHLRVTTDVMVGFPGEDEREYEISRDFIARQALAGLHVFRFSPRPGTPATRMRRQIPESTKRERSTGLRRLGESLARDYAREIEGQTQEVLWEQVAGATPEGFVNVGYTDTWMRVRAIHPRPLSNEITAARLGCYRDGEFQATAIL
ncbi:MAG: MiaB/RimO family radical SAM methylthiotransferase [Anaerolineaceae bacterium]|nr:MiaB/RimO family radical SAM methylthiotransferase [Anaerolineaceae bacterium]MCY3906171.1 MiaB/RimO family radical SAM methylthiotransferase [Anaerolineaceae bacterium]